VRQDYQRGTAMLDKANTFTYGYKVKAGFLQDEREMVAMVEGVRMAVLACRRGRPRLVHQLHHKMTEALVEQGFVKRAELGNGSPTWPLRAATCVDAVVSALEV